MVRDKSFIPVDRIHRFVKSRNVTFYLIDYWISDNGKDVEKRREQIADRLRDVGGKNVIPLYTLFILVSEKTASKLHDWLYKESGLFEAADKLLISAFFQENAHHNPQIIDDYVKKGLPRASLNPCKTPSVRRLEFSVFRQKLYILGENNRYLLPGSPLHT